MKKKKKKPEPEEEEEDYDFIHIDEMNLDREWINHPGLYFKWARKLADARMEADELKARIEVVAAELDKDIRESPSLYEVEKVTEAAVKSAVIAQETYQKAVRRFGKAKHKVDIYQAAVNTLDHRKRALENLVDLHSQNYFSSPRAKQEIDKDRLDKAKERAIYNKHKRKQDKD